MLLANTILPTCELRTAGRSRQRSTRRGPPACLRKLKLPARAARLLLAKPLASLFFLRAMRDQVTGPRMLRSPVTGSQPLAGLVKPPRRKLPR
eukprot:3249763-Amphidinium_carterae.2